MRPGLAPSRLSCWLDILDTEASGLSTELYLSAAAKLAKTGLVAWSQKPVARFCGGDGAVIVNHDRPFRPIALLSCVDHPGKCRAGARPPPRQRVAGDKPPPY